MGCNAKQRAECNSGRIGRFGRYIVLFFVKMALVQTCSPSQALTRQIPPFVAARHLPRSGGSPSSKGEPLAIHASFISLPKPLPLGEVDLRSKDGEGEDADLVTTLFSRESRSGKHSLVQTQKGPPQCAAVPFALMKNYPYGERKWLVTLPQQAGSF